jgi:hypothetical protein
MDFSTSVAYNYNETTKEYTKCYPVTHMNAVYTKDDETETLGNKLADIDDKIEGTERVFLSNIEPEKDGLWFDINDQTTSLGENSIVTEIKSYINDGVQNEINTARGSYSNLSSRLNNITTQISEDTQNITTNIDNISTINQKAFSLQDLFLQQWARKMKDGFTVIIDVWGDSTEYGAIDSASGRADRPAPSIMQDILRTYFNNQNITVNNKGHNGYATWNVIDTWDTEMANSIANIIYINYGINNRWQDAKVLKQDLTKMIQICRKYGKEVVLETPNIVMNANPVPATDSGGNPIGGNPIHCYYTMEHAQITRDLARDLGICLIDQYELTQQYNYYNTILPNNSADGMHPSQEVYFKKGTNDCIPFIAPSCAKVRIGDIISAVDSSVMATSYSSSQSISTANSTDSGAQISIAFFVEDNGVDISLALTCRNTSCSSVEINLDGKYIGTINLKTLNTDTVYFIDNEFVVAKGLTRGLHTIILNNTTGETVELNYAKVYKSNKLVNGITEYNKKTIANNSSVNAITNIPTDIFLNDLDISFTTTLADGKGISVLANKTSTGTNLGLVLGVSGGYLIFAECNPTGYQSLINIVADTNYKNVNHTYRIVVTKTKNLTIYCDGTSIYTKTLTQNYLGGFVGFWNTIAGITKLDIEKVVV